VVPLDGLTVRTFRVPTDAPTESDGTFAWNATTLVLVETFGGGASGLGYSYANSATATLIHDSLADVARGMNVLAIAEIRAALVQAVRNVGRAGIASMAISAMDTALWDLKAKLLELPLVSLLGGARDRVPVYGSGGFTSYTVRQLCDQLAAWVNAGIPRVKMKVGRDPVADVDRVRAVRSVIGVDAELFVDANGGYERKQALAQAERFNESGVTWFEEPVYHRDLAGLRFVRDRAPSAMEVSVGEYGYAPSTFAEIIRRGAVDVVQADATRCEGITGLLIVDGLCEATGTPLSTHCAPALHAHVACAAKRVRHVEYFHDHVRIERLLFDGVLSPIGGALQPDLSRPGFGLELKAADAVKYESA
jgi:L-alanine-DL-glutamate epimerase-like enolase superfamily enzyme